MRNKNDITNTLGFYHTYFDLLPFYKTQEDAFNFLNYEVEHIRGKKLFKCYCDFKKSVLG